MRTILNFLPVFNWTNTEKQATRLSSHIGPGELVEKLTTINVQQKKPVHVFRSILTLSIYTKAKRNQNLFSTNIW